MRLTRFSDIGLRVLMYLAQTGEQRSPATVSEIASQFDIPVNHMVKVVAQLSRIGWIHALRGRNGGLRLNVQASELRIGRCCAYWKAKPSWWIAKPRTAA